MLFRSGLTFGLERANTGRARVATGARVSILRSAIHRSLVGVTKRKTGPKLNRGHRTGAYSDDQDLRATFQEVMSAIQRAAIIFFRFFAG